MRRTLPARPTLLARLAPACFLLPIAAVVALSTRTARADEATDLEGLLGDREEATE